MIVRYSTCTHTASVTRPAIPFVSYLSTVCKITVVQCNCKNSLSHDAFGYLWPHSNNSRNFLWCKGAAPAPESVPHSRSQSPPCCWTHVAKTPTDRPPGAQPTQTVGEIVKGNYIQFISLQNKLY